MAPFVIYADLETVLAEVDITYGKTHVYQKHMLCCVRGHLLGKSGRDEWHVLPVHRGERAQAAHRLAYRVKG